MSNYTITGDLECLPDEKVMVRNYRRGNVWESGVCTDVCVHVLKGGSHVSYEVRLDREPAPNKRRRKMVRPLTLQVSDGAIKRISENTDERDGE